MVNVESADPASVTEQVRAFYGSLPFNVEDGVGRAASTVRAVNQIARAYGPLDGELRANPSASVLDVGCGAGRFVNTVAFHYGASVTGVDLCEPALRRAAAVASALRIESRARFVAANLFHLGRSLGADARFAVVNSLGVLHHTADCRGALAAIAPFVAPAGLLHLGLYHRHGRRPFLELFEPFRRRLRDASTDAERRRIEDDAVREYGRLHQGLTDETLVRSWCRDQVFHPHETQHTLQEAVGWLEEVGLQPWLTSINRFERVADWAGLYKLEPSLAELSYQRNVREGRYYPGFFIVLARRPAESSTR